MEDRLEMSILYVEDDTAVMKLFCAIIENKVTKVYTAENGLEGLKMFQEKNPQLVITDIQMPKMDGIEMAERIKKIDKDVEIIAISAIDEPYSLINAINSGISRFLLKPVNMHKLYTIIDEIYKTTSDRIELNNYRKHLEEILEEKTQKLEKSNKLFMEELEHRRRNEEKIIMLSRVVEQSPNAIAILDLEGKVEYINTEYTKLTAYNYKDLLGKPLFDEVFIKNKEEILISLRNKKGWKNEFRNRRKDSSYYWETVSYSPILNYDDEVIHYMLTKEEITDRKNMEKELIKSKNEAESASKSKSQFLANMSHEIRTPMNGILLMSDILLSSNLDKQQVEVCNLLKNSAKSLLRIINDILDFSKIEAGKLEIEETECDIKKMMIELIDMFSLITRKKNLKLDYYLEDKIPEKTMGDSKRIKQILINLIGNAVKFTEKGGVKVRVTVEDENKYKLKLKFSVEDSGIGIEEEDMKKIFKDFVQADSSYTKKFEGTGLGLAISKRIVELLDGKIWAKSIPNSGSEFYFTTHLKKLNAKEEAEANYKEKKYKIPSNNKNQDVKILLVEDNKVNQLALLTLLNLKNWYVEIASDGRIAVDKWNESTYDLILMDIQMPNLNGIEATKLIRKTELLDGRGHIPIFAVTAYAMEEDIEKFKNAGIDDYITKPIDFSLLSGKIIETLDLE